jgi:hypothetical protein
MADESDALGLVLYDVCGDWWVVRDLLDENVYLSAPLGIWPVAIEQSELLDKRDGQEDGYRTYSPRTGLSGLMDVS